mmetsp:Transcript_44759/g.91352  ORF Transcript_44759/g.91352 Transcript_44759/m.91352 type:complete len:229 (-) Transcript_44759:298-984(-)
MTIPRTILRKSCKMEFSGRERGEARRSPKINRTPNQDAYVMTSTCWRHVESQSLLKPPQSTSRSLMVRSSKTSTRSSRLRALPRTRRRESLRRCTEPTSLFRVSGGRQLARSLQRRAKQPLFPLPLLPPLSNRRPSPRLTSFPATASACGWTMRRVGRGCSAPCSTSSIPQALANSTRRRQRTRREGGMRRREGRGRMRWRVYRAVSPCNGCTSNWTNRCARETWERC